VNNEEELQTFYEEWPPRFPQKCENVGHVAGGAEMWEEGQDMYDASVGTGTHGQRGQDAWDVSILLKFGETFVMIVQSFQNFGNSLVMACSELPKVWSRNFLC